MKPVFVHDLAYALGGQRFSVEESAKAGRLFTDAQQFSEAGFAFHRMCSASQSAYDLAVEAVSQIKNSLNDVNSIIYATCLPLNGNIGSFEKFKESRDVKYLMDYPASHLQADFGLENAAVLGLNQQACTSMLGSLRLARALIISEPEQSKILCVTADRFPEGASYEQAYNVISDGAAACLLSTEEKGFRLVATHALTNGALAQANDDETVGSYFSYTHRLLTEIFQKSGLTMDEIDWIIPQNTNVNAWVILSRLLGTEYEKVYFKSIKEVGHIISSDNIVNLAKIEEEKLVKPGQKLLLFMAGFGLNWQAVILEKV
ncbi:MAG: 3-oxoacyl-[acyl-carrier-protein] synthase III C-terminal domain-containing protein [Pseudobdellovibrionaceae bacterium]